MSGATEHASGVRTRLWRDGKWEKDGFPFAEVSDHLAEDGALVWADVVSPDEGLINELCAELSLDRHAIEDATTLHERPKATRYQSHLFVTTFALSPRTDGPGVEVGRVSAFVLPRGLITVRLDEHFDIDEVLQRWDDNNDLTEEGPLALLHGLLDYIVDGYFTAIEALDGRIEELEDKLFDENSIDPHVLQREMFNTRKTLSRLRKLTQPMREVVTTILRRVVDRDANGRLVPYYEDLYDHTLRTAEWSDSLRDALSSIYDANLSLSDVRMNTIMKKLTAWAAIIAVPTAITGWFGQNVPYPGFGHPWGVFLSLFSILLIAAVLYVSFKRRDWL